MLISLFSFWYIIDTFFETNPGIHICFSFRLCFSTRQWPIVYFAKHKSFRKFTINIILCHIYDIIWVFIGNNFICLFTTVFSIFTWFWCLAQGAALVCKFYVIQLQFNCLLTTRHKFACFDVTSRVDVDYARCHPCVRLASAVGRASEQKSEGRGFVSHVGLTLYLKSKNLSTTWISYTWISYIYIYMYIYINIYIYI